VRSSKRDREKRKRGKQCEKKGLFYTTHSSKISTKKATTANKKKQSVKRGNA